MKKTLYLLIAICSCLASCKKNDSNTSNSVNIQTGDVVVLNQGNFHTNEASATLFNPSNKDVTANIFQTVNNRVLGSVGQSMLVYNGKGYIVVNATGTIEVVDMTTFKSLGTISGLGSPRFILPIGNNQAYVSDIYYNIKVIDLNAYKIIDSLPIPGETEQMVMANGTAYILYIANYDTSYVLMVNPTNNAKTGSITLPLHYADAMVKDSTGNLWVLCSPGDTTAAGLVKVSTATNTVSQTFTYAPSATAYYSALTEAPDGNTLCYLGPLGVYKMTASGGQLPSTAFISQGTHYFFGTGIDNAGANIYIGDATSYSANDSVYVYSLSSGSPVNSFLAGIAPWWFVFK